VSSPAEITTVSDLDLSSSEDSVQSLQNIATKDGLVVIAGVNSSASDQQAGKNEHFRTYNVPFPPRNKGDFPSAEKAAPITSLGQSAIFRPSTATKKETYQRLLRLSRPDSREAGSKRLGAIATGFAPKAEIVLFDASETPDASSVRGRINLPEGQEANDIDIAEHKSGQFGLVYCMDDAVYLHSCTYDFATKMSKNSTEAPILLYTTPPSQKHGFQKRLRCVRWLSPHHVLLALNTANKTGGELLVLRLSSNDNPGKITVRRSLPRSIKSVVSLATCPLDADPGSGDRQIIVAVAGQDMSIHIFSLDYSPSKSVQVSKFNHYKSLSDVHSLSISKIAFSNFYAPSQNPTSTMSIATMPQYVKLASVSMGNTVVVDTLTLSSTPTKPHDTADASTVKRNSPSVRWVLSAAGTELLRSWTGILMVSFTIFITAYLLQSYINATGGFSTTVRSFLPPGARPGLSVPEAVSKQAAAASNTAENVAHLVQNKPPQVINHASANAASAIWEAVDYATHEASAVRSAITHATPIVRLRDLVSRLSSHAHSSATGAVVVLDAPSGPTASIVPDAETLRNSGASKFEELTPEERERWKAALAAAGQWSVGEGETVLKSIFFSQVAAVVGGAVRDAVIH